MSLDYTCDIIKDLLPGYVDGVLSEAGTKLVKDHLEQCEPCRNSYRELKEDMEADAEVSEEELLVLDGFKKIQRRTRRLKYAVGLIAGLLLVFVCVVFRAVYVMGQPLSTSLIQLSDVVYDEETGSLTLEGTLGLSGHHVGRVVWKPGEEEANAVNILVYAAKTPPFGGGDDTFSITIPDIKGRTAYLACPEYDQLEIYSWKKAHQELLGSLEEEIYRCMPELDRARDILNYSGGIETVDGRAGITFHVDHLAGEGAAFWYVDGQLVTDGELKPADFAVWISLEAPHQILIR